MRNILRLSAVIKKLGGKTAEEKYAEASECWNTDPERVADAAEKYFMPPKFVRTWRQRPRCNTAHCHG